VLRYVMFIGSREGVLLLLLLMRLQRQAGGQQRCYWVKAIAVRMLQGGG